MWDQGSKRWNFTHDSARSPSVPVDTIVLHYTTGTYSAEALCSAWSKPDARNASAHFVVGRAGDVHQGVSLSRTAWHAGRGHFMGDSRPYVMNQRSVGIELSNAGFGVAHVDPENIRHHTHRNPLQQKQEWERYYVPQISALDALLRRVKALQPSLKYVTGHEDVLNSFLTGKPGAKSDPGPAFPWMHIDWDSMGLVVVRYDYETRQHVKMDMPEHEAMGTEDRSDGLSECVPPERPFWQELLLSMLPWLGGQ